MMNSMSRILNGLIRQTGEGRLAWRMSVDSDQFVASIDTIAVVLQRLPSGDLLNPERFRLQVLNDEGVAIESLESQDSRGRVPAERRATDEQNGEMSRLFTLARRSALDSDSTLEKLAERLENFQ